MAWIPMYLMKQDVEYLNDWLNQEEEIAFIVSNGDRNWIAQKQHTIITDIGKQIFAGEHDTTMRNCVEYHLWHVPSGPLPILGGSIGGLKFKNEDWNHEGKILNPWTGWTEIRTGANSRVPYFGAGHPGVINLEIRISETDEIPISTFGWIGNHYKIIGDSADPSTEKFWHKLKRMVKKVSIQIPRSNNLEAKKEIFAFPAAYKEIENGRPCSVNP